MTNIIAYGAARIRRDNPSAFDDMPTTLDEWKAKNIPDIRAAWASIRKLAMQGHPLAANLVKIDAAMQAKKLAEHEGTEVPAAARETLSFLDEYQNAETQNLDEALALLSQALA
jgi:hypothetical protein